VGSGVQTWCLACCLLPAAPTKQNHARPFCLLTAAHTLLCCAALEAMERLMAHWHQTTAKHPRSPAAAAAATTPATTPASTHSSASSRRRLSDAAGDDEPQMLPFQQQQQRPGGGAVGISFAPCEHVACSQQTFCLVEEMERLKRNYHGRTDQVRLSWFVSGVWVAIRPPSPQWHCLFMDRQRMISLNLAAGRAAAVSKANWPAVCAVLHCFAARVVSHQGSQSSNPGAGAPAAADTGTAGGGHNRLSVSGHTLLCRKPFCCHQQQQVKAAWLHSAS
jgi:hypothetical protein